MTITVANTEITNTFDYWRARTNEVAYALTNKVVSVDSNAAVGNAQVFGVLFANTLSGNTITITGALSVNSITTNTVTTNTVIASNVVTSNIITTTIALNSTTVNSSYYTGTAANANTLGGQSPSYYLNTSTSHANAAGQEVIITGAYNSLGANLSTTGVTATSYGNSTFYPTFTVDSKGRLTVASVQEINASINSLSVNNAVNLNGQPASYYLNTSTAHANAAGQEVIITGAYNSLGANLSTTGVVAASYGNSTYYPTFTVDSKGRLTLAGVQSLNTSTSQATVNNALFLEGSNTQFFTNATNITTGTLAWERAPTGTVNNTGNFTMSGNLTFTSVNNSFSGRTTFTGAVAVNTAGIIIDNSATLVSYTTTDSSSTQSGSAVFRGGVGINKNLYANGVGAAAYFNNANVGGNLGVIGAIYLNSTVVNSSYYTGTASNANTLGGQTPSYYLNTSTSHANAAAQDVVISGTYDSLIANLSTTGVTAGSYGSATTVATFTVNSKGRLTTASSTAINVNTALGYTPLSTASTFANSAAQDVIITGTFSSLGAALSTTGVTAATYGNTTSIPTITVDSKGRITAVVNTTITTSPNATYVQNTDSRTLSGNLNFTGTNTFFSSGITLGGATTLNIGTLSVSNNAGNLDLNGSGITDFRGQRQAKTASYTLANTDSGTIIELTTAGTTVANTFTLPSNAPDGFNCTLVQYGTTTLQIQAGAGSTLQKRTGIGANSTIANTGGQYAMATVYCRGSSVWVLGGDVI